MKRLPNLSRVTLDVRNGRLTPGPATMRAGRGVAGAVGAE